MKKYLIAMTMLMTLATTQVVMAQGQQKSEEQELVDSTRQEDALEAYSDTTQVADSTVVSSQHRIGGYGHGGNSVVEDVFGNIDVEDMMGMTFVLAVLMIIFVIAPVLILGLLLFFIYRNRKQKMKLAEMAVKQGQPIPDQLLIDHKETDDELWQKGIRQTFLGIGLMIFLGYTAGEIGVAIGALVACLGVGKLVIVKTSKR